MIMSSPFSLKTKRGTEETIEALNRTVYWASKIDTTNDATEVTTDFVEELNKEEERLRRKHKIKNTERAIDNFVFNQYEKVQKILCGDLDTKVSAIGELNSYINEEFGYVNPPNKEELLWLTAQEVHRKKDRMEEYSEKPVSNIQLLEQGKTPELWKNEDYPIYHN
jgi:hypothetical protein